MAKKKIKTDLSEPLEIPMDKLDFFVVKVIDSLKGAKDPYAVAYVKNIMVTPVLQEMFLFVGITTKQSESDALFAWTEAVKSSKVSWPSETETK